MPAPAAKRVRQPAAEASAAAAPDLTPSPSQPAPARNNARGQATPAVDCSDCPLRLLPCFQPVQPQELRLIDELKQAELAFEAGATLIAEQADNAPLYTLLEGWAFRAKHLGDGRRQILGVLLPGDFIGLQQRMSERNLHAVVALTAVRVCSFPRDTIRRVHERLPSLAMDLTWIAARGESVVDDHLLSVGRRSARERIAALLLVLWLRAAQLQLRRPDGSLAFPLTQRHLADLLGLSLVHTNRHLRSLVKAGLVAVPAEGLLRVDDERALAAAGHLRWPVVVPQRPLI